MANRTGNYCAFYVKTPFKESNLGAHAAKDFVYYNMRYMAGFFRQVKNRFYILTSMKNYYEKVKIYRRTNYFHS